MQKSSFLFLLIIAGVALIGAYQALVPVQAGVPQAIIRFLALSAFFLLCVSLLIGPLAVLWPQKFVSLIEPRRAVGIAAFVFGTLHVFLAISIYFDWDIGAILTFMPLVIAIPAFFIMLALTLTACDFAVKKLGMANWKTIQRFAYLAFILLFAHFLLQATGLYSKDGKPVTLNIAELALVLLGIATIILQIVGFVTFRKRQAASKAAVASTATETQSKTAEEKTV